MLQQKKNEIIKFMIDDIEGGYADLAGDRGGETVYGISSRWFPSEYQKIVNGEWSIADVTSFYAREFAGRIVRFDDLLALDPRFATILLYGKVHGTGLRDYTRVIQRSLVDRGIDLKIDGSWGPRTAGALLAATRQQRDEIFSDIVDARSSLIESRTKSVGGYENGMRNRINKVLIYASTLSPRIESPTEPGREPGPSVSQWVAVSHAGANFSIKVG
jgi:lysozyme family protein